MKFASIWLLGLLMLTAMPSAFGMANTSAMVRSLQRKQAKALKTVDVEPQAWLQRAERTFQMFMDKGPSPAQERVLRVLGGGIALYFGRHFTLSLLFLTSFRQSGWPIVRNALKELKTSWTDARRQMKEELPTLLATKKMLPKMIQDAEEAITIRDDVTRAVKELEAESKRASKVLTQARRDYASTLKGDKEDVSFTSKLAVVQRAVKDAQKESTGLQERLADTMAAKAKAEATCAKLQRDYKQALRSVNSIAAVANAANPEHIKSVVQGLGVGLVGCVAAATSPVAGAALLGSRFGNILSTRVGPVVHGLAVERAGHNDGLVKWVDTAVSGTCSAFGLLVAHQTKMVTLVASGIFSGAQIITEALSDQCEAQFGQRLENVTLTVPKRFRSKIEELEREYHLEEVVPVPGSKITAATLLSGTLVFTGFFKQYVPGAGGWVLGGPVKFILMPLLALESTLGVLTSRAQINAAAGGQDVFKSAGGKIADLLANRGVK